jgi:type II secretory pathway component PulJ
MHVQLGAASSGADAKRAAGYVRAEVKQLEAARARATGTAHARTLLLLQGQAHQQLYRQVARAPLC